MQELLVRRNEGTVEQTDERHVVCDSHRKAFRNVVGSRRTDAPCEICCKGGRYLISARRNIRRGTRATCRTNDLVLANEAAMNLATSGFQVVEILDKGTGRLLWSLERDGL